jgi:2-aminoadipate transaminase
MGSAIDASMSVLADDPRDIISLAMGSPAPDAIPAQALAVLTAEVLGGPGASAALDYMPTEGDPSLRRALLERLASNGLDVDPRCLIITSGGMQGLDLVCRLFLKPGDLVLAESPSYPNGMATIHNHGARLAQIPMDEHGMDLDAARSTIRSIGQSPRMIYAIPSFQNPSGTTYSIERRRGLLEFAESINAIVLEDDPYSELRFEGEPIPSLLELDGDRGRVIQVRTFSKIVAPGLRLGWVVAAADTIKRMVAARQSMDTCANALAQRTVARFVSTGALDQHVAELRRKYPERRDALVGALVTSLDRDRGFRWTVPSGGMFVWLELPKGLDGDRLMLAALEKGVAVVPGSAFDPVRCQHAVRLCYAAVDEDRARAGVALLAEAVDSLAWAT